VFKVWEVFSKMICITGFYCSVVLTQFIIPEVSMDKLGFIVERLNQPPFEKGLSTMTELDGKSPSELLRILCDIVIAIDPDMENLNAESTENKIGRIISFLQVMKYITDDQVDNFTSFMMEGDKETMFNTMEWTLHKFEHLRKRAYLAKYLMPLEIPPEFQSDDRVYELSETLKELQANFKDVHKRSDASKNSGLKPSEYKNEIFHLEQERGQLSQKIQKLKKEAEVDEPYFRDMLKVIPPSPLPPPPDPLSPIKTCQQLIQC
jgi:intraflagellar transport protein 81